MKALLPSTLRALCKHNMCLQGPTTPKDQRCHSTGIPAPCRDCFVKAVHCCINDEESPRSSRQGHQARSTQWWFRRHTQPTSASSNYEHHCRRRDVETDDVDGCGDLNHEIARCDLGQGHSSQRSVEDQRNHRFIGPQQCRRTAWQLNMSRNTFYTTYMVVPWAPDPGFLEPSRKSLRPLLMWRQRSGSLSPSSTNTPRVMGGTTTHPAIVVLQIIHFATFLGKLRYPTRS